MAELAKKKIWFVVTRKDTDSTHRSQDKDAKPVAFTVDIEENQSGQTIKEAILQSCGLCNLTDIVLKLRNHRGSLIPITWNLSTNTITRPYGLEIVKVHQNIMANPRTVKIKGVNDTMKDKLATITHRIEKLEKAAPALKEKRNDKIDKEMKEVEQMLQFLAKRLQDAETVKWEGMFKKNPLW